MVGAAPASLRPYQAQKLATRISVERMPTPSAGVKLAIGNRNPVRLVSNVVHRKTPVVRGRMRPPAKAGSATSPVRMPTTLIATWTSVNCDRVRPRIMAHLLRTGGGGGGRAAPPPPPAAYQLLMKSSRSALNRS